MATSRASRRTRTIDWYLAVPLIGPALLLLANNADFMFDPPGWIDTFAMLGRFWHYLDHNPLFEAYRGSRLPWLLPGFVFFNLFDAVTASYLLHAGALILSSVLLYLLVRDTMHDRLAAAVSAAAWSCYTWIHGDGGWNYHILGASMYYLAGLWMLARALTTRSRAWTIAAGAALACAIHTHLVFAGFLPIVAVMGMPFVQAGPHPPARTIMVLARDLALGAIGVTGILAAVNAGTGGEWLFFVPQIEYTLDMARRGNRWLRPPSVWLRDAHHLTIPVLTLLAAALSLIAARRSERDETTDSAPFRQVFIWQGFLAFGLMAFLQFGRGQTAFDPSYLAPPLYCHIFPLIGVLLVSMRKGATRGGDIALALGAAVVIVLPLLLLLPTRLPQHAAALLQTGGLHDLPPVVPPLLCGGALVMVLGRLRGRVRLATFAVSFGLLNAWLTPFAGAYGIGTPGVNRDMLIVFESLDRYTATLDPSLFSIRFWGEPATVQTSAGAVNSRDVFVSFLSTRRRSLITAAYDRPDIGAEELTLADLYDENCLGLLSDAKTHPELVTRVRRRFEQLEAPLTVVGDHEARSGDLSIALTVLRLPSEEQHAGPPCVSSR